MAWTVLTESTAGAPQNLSVDGSLNDVLRWALPLLGWDVEYGATGDATVFRSPSGDRMRLQVRHAAAVSGGSALAYVRAAHTATSATSVGSPFPTAVQVPNNGSNWAAGHPSDAATPIRYIIAGNDRFFYYFSESYANVWDLAWFGQVPSMYSTGYETLIRVRNSASAGFPAGMLAPGNAYPIYSNSDFWARGINASTVSVSGSPLIPGAFGSIGNCPPMQGGYQNRILRQKVAMSDFGSTTTSWGVLALPNRGWLPNLWAPWHSGMGGVAPLDTFTDTVYNPAASFMVIGSPAYGVSVILETTDTWSIPT